MASITVTWTEATPVSGLLPYRLTVRNNSTGSVAATTNPAATATTATVTGLAAGTSFTIELQAQNSAGYSTAATAIATTPSTTSPPPPPVSPPPPPVASGVLPFDMPARSVLASSSKKVWYHWMGGAFEISVDDKDGSTDPTEYWRRYWMPPGTTEGAGQSWAVNHNVYGGLVRQRKQTRPPRGANYDLLDYETEITQVIASGGDGFTSEILQVPVSGSNPQRWAQINRLLQAADVIGDPTFTLTLMPDSSTIGSNVSNVVNALNTLSSRRVTRINGRLVIAPYAPEMLGLTFWTNVLNGLRNLGHDPVFWPCYQSSVWSSGQAPTFDGIAYGHSRWGVRDPVQSSSNDNTNAGAPAYCHNTFGKPWMQPVSVGDERPNQGVYNERRNTDQLVASWMAAINAGANCDWVQIPTWDDFAEGANICPTQSSGWFWLDISAYFLVRYKTGTWPTIIRDAIYLNHRRQPTSGVTYSSGQTSFQSLTGGTPTSNQVEALVFTTQPTGTVTLTVKGVPSTFNIATMTPVAPGVYSCKAPLATGSTSATLVRNGATVASVNGPVPIASSQVSQDMSYYGASSLR